jgi:pyruvate/2-oxoglutarate/acetoin dehydrogenase E1 component
VRVAENLNQALHAVLGADPDVHLLGEDILDPYGGAFKITKGLSTRFPDQVRGTPLSEGAIVGVAAGLAMAGEKAIVEIMFGDFAALAFDQIVNFAAKSVSMYGRPVRLPLVIRCPSGGHRGYGPTHSQNLQKHFIGVPGLSLFELSPFHDARPLLAKMLALGEPSLLFEDKVLYTRQQFQDGRIDDLFQYDLVEDVARVYVEDPDDAEVVLIAPGGLAHRAMDAMRELLIRYEISCVLLVSTRLYPFDAEALLPLPRRTRAVCVAEDGSAGGTWGSEVAARLHEHLWGRLRGPVRLVNAADRVIPAAAHLEREVLVNADTIRDAVLEAAGDR